MTSPPQPTTAVSLNPPRHKLQSVQVKTSSPRFPPSPTTPTLITSPSHRRIGIAVDLSDESAYAVKWAVHNYLRPGDTVILLHVRSTSVLYGADWGSSTPTATTTPPNSSFPKISQQQMEEEYDNFTTTKANHVAEPLVDAHVALKIHIVKDHDMKERLCLEVERLGLSTVIMGSRGIGALRSSSKGMLGSVSDYCVQHCACPVVVVRYNQTEAEAEAEEEQHHFHDAHDQQN
ncbi:hypothetical protein BUALT_Bualt03G0202900 [Buddleja alternifolia]|uniref:UspA domain-containing protein n=1 Tax=Buddleja alternifolia TaxID=168488 RepID=A0AAV6Y2L9_9LAMI|nr:hypothetical protein BUALT_Bualt03G0202900 [Buddleja alternifolia]